MNALAKKKPQPTKKKKPAPKPKSKRASFRLFIKKFLDQAQENIKALKFVPVAGKIETQEEGIERTRKLETAQAVFDAIRKIHEAV